MTWDQTQDLQHGNPFISPPNYRSYNYICNTLTQKQKGKQTFKRPNKLIQEQVLLTVHELERLSQLLLTAHN